MENRKVLFVQFKTDVQSALVGTLYLSETLYSLFSLSLLMP
jgi:hypothetical protein